MPGQKQFRFNTIKILIKYFVKSFCSRIEIWLMFSIVLLVFSIFCINTIRSVTKDVFVVSANIYEQSIFASVVFVCVFSSLLQTLHISKDIDSRVYESYLYGPVDETCYIISIFVSYSIVNFFAIVCFPLTWILLITFLVGIVPSATAIISILFGYLLSNLILFIAMCIGAATRKSKLAIWYLLLFHVTCIGIVLGDTIVSKYLLPLKRSDVDLFSFFRSISHFLFNLSVYFSPYTQFYIFQKNIYHSKLILLIFPVAVIAAQILFAFISKCLFKRSIK